MSGPLSVPLVVSQAVARALGRLLERCRSLGLIAVNADGTSATHDAPWLVAERTLSALRRIMPDAEPVELWTGVRALALTLEHRSHCKETIYVLGLSEEARPAPGVTLEAFEEARATSAQRLAVLGEALRLGMADLLTEAEASADVLDLADQLADTYETLHLLYGLGRSMTELNQPERFVAGTCARLRQTLGFGYVAVHIPQDAQVGAEICGRTIWDGSPGEGEDQQTLDRLLQVVARVGGVSDVFRGPQTIIKPLTSDRGVVGMIVAGDKAKDGGNISSYDSKLVDAASGFLSTFLTNTRLYDEQRRLVMGVLEALSTAIDAKDPYTRGHSQRVAHLAGRIALALGMDEAAAERVRICGLLHDVGKIGVPEAVLRKSGKLTDAEFAAMKLHPQIGYRILKDLNVIQDVLPGVLHHHERIDGRGYPNGLSGESIPLIARIIAAADTFDAMSSTRSYREKLPRERVLEEIHRIAGAQLDARVAQALLQLDLRDFDELVARHASLSSFDADLAA